MYIHMHIYIIFSNPWTPVLLLHLLQAQSVMIIPHLNWVLMASIQLPSNLHGARASILQMLATCFSQRKTHRVLPTKNMGSGASYSPLGRWGGYWRSPSRTGTPLPATATPAEDCWSLLQAKFLWYLPRSTLAPWLIAVTLRLFYQQFLGRNCNVDGVFWTHLGVSEIWTCFFSFRLQRVKSHQLDLLPYS